MSGFAVFFVVLLIVLGGLNFHAYRWACRAFSLPPARRRALAWLLGVSLGGMTLGRMVDGVLPSALARVLLFTVSTVQLAVVISAVLLLLVDLALGARRLLAWGLRSVRPAQSAAVAKVESPVLPRRALLTQAVAGSAFLIGGSSSLYGALVGRHDYSIEDVPLRLPGLSRALDGFSIVQLSDVHIGTFVGDAELEAAFDLIRSARPDLVVLTGDLVDHDARLAERLGRFVRRLAPLAREGVAAIPGNHDYYAGIVPVLAALEGAGAQVFRNRGRVIGGAQGFALLGVDDPWARRLDPSAGPDLDEAVRSLPPLDGTHRARDLPRLLLCHNFSYFERAAGHVQLQLSGHTHGGQVNLLVRPGELFMKHGWISGAYERNGSRLYINRGFGTAGPPARIGAPPEITRVVLTT